MVDEMYEVQQYLKGESIVFNNLYRTCWLMARWHKQQGLCRMDIRNAIKEWGENNGIELKFDINGIVDKIFDKEGNIALKSPVIKINKQDIANIDKRFDNKKTKFVALAMMCYAKGHARKDGVFFVPAVSLSVWVGINRKSLTNKYINELINYELLKMVSAAPDFSQYKNLPYSEQGTGYKFNVRLHNSGEYVLEGNDMQKLFSEIYFPLSREKDTSHF